MPANRNALIRYKTIDQCLQNRYRKWTLDDLIDAVSDALYEYEGIPNGISKRTVQGDIQMMRSDKLGYNAPIIVEERKYYTYEDPKYSITNIPLTNQDLGKLAEAVEFLKQFQGFSHFRELGGMVQKLEDHIYSAKEKQRPIIDFETNPNLKGLEHLDFIYQAIVKQQVLVMTYQSFKASTANTFSFHAYLLKEFNNRWFVLGKKGREGKLLTLALDRIIEVAIEENEVYYSDNSFDASEYYKNIIGVTVMEGNLPEKVTFKVDKSNAPYVATKPIHHSQIIVETKEDGSVVFQITIKINFELERMLLGFGETLEVISPNRLRRTMKRKFKKALETYEK